jgi:asparagine synthase (glutamine-hydrolysing)
MGDVSFGLLISGGVDSSLIAAIVMRLIKKGEVDLKKRGMTEIHSFCIGVEGSTDLKAARIIADFLGTTHHDIIYTCEEGIDAIPDVVYAIETYN